MDTLFLAHRAPFPPDKGDRLRAWRHIERLARLGPVDVVAPADDERAAARAREGLAAVCREVHVFARRRALALARVGAALLGGGSLTEAWLRDGRIARALDDLQRRHAYGLCWAFSSGTGPWWRAVRARRRVVDLCDLDALKWEALGRDARGPIAFVRRTEARRLLPREVALGEQADLVFVSTRQEAEDLRARSTPRRLEILTNGTPWRDVAALPPPSRAGPVLGFLGQMDYPPNIEAARHLAREVLPRVRARVPGARLRVMGRAPAAAVRALASDAVEVTGEVASIPAALASIRVFVAPLEMGRGLPNKILEAMATGRAVVVSSWSARALLGAPGRDYEVADGAEERARLVAALLEDDARCDRLGTAGAAYVRREHDWDAVLDGMAAAIEALVADPDAPVAAGRR